MIETIQPDDKLNWQIYPLVQVQMLDCNQQETDRDA